MNHIWQIMPFSTAVTVNPTVRLARDESYPFIEMADVGNGLSGVQQVSERAYTGGGARFEAGDTIFARITPCLENGKIARVPKLPGGRSGFGSTEFVVMRGKEGVTDSQFVYYLSISPHVRHYAIHKMTGTSGRQRVPTEAFDHLEIALPPLAEQREIAGILGALDDKIALNRQMNATLEAIARALFQSWFVDFDPVRAKAEGRAPDGLDDATAALFPDSFDDSALGPIPSGWRVGTLGEIAQNFDARRVPLSRSQREQRPGEHPYFGAAGVVDYVDDWLFDGVHLLFAEDGSVKSDDGSPVLQYVWGQFWVNNHAHVLSGKGITTEHLFMYCKNIQVDPFITGAVQPKISQANLNRIPLVLAPEPINQAVKEFTDPLFAQYRLIEDQSRTLAETRDALLPKLVSGELRVGGVGERGRGGRI